MIFSENRYPPPELGCSRVLAPYKWTQIGNIRFAVVKPEGRLFRDHALIATQVILHGVGGYVYECDCEAKTDHDAEDEHQSGFHLRLSESEDPATRSFVKSNTIVPLSKRLIVGVPTAFSCCQKRLPAAVISVRSRRVF
jgi:hypothetical protein